MEYVIALFFLIINVYLISLFTYYFQVKDYMFYRFWSWIKEKSFNEILFPESMLLPAKSLRNLVIAGGSFVSMTIFILWGLFLENNIILFGSVSVIVSLCMIFGLVMLTSPIAENKRKKLVEESKSKLVDSKTTFIGITGSFGKSSTKEFLSHILSSKFKVAKTIKNHNTLWGVSISINNELKIDSDFFIAEIGAYQKGNIEEVAEMINPKFAILTGLGNQHVSLFGSRNNLIEAKKELLLALDEDSIAYVNMDSDGYELAISDLKCKVKLYSINNKKADIYIEDYEIQEKQIKATILYNNKDVRITVNLVGKHNLSNLLPCVALALDLDIPIPQIQKKCKSLEQVESKLSVVEGINKSIIINDSYNSNLDGFLSALEVLSQQEATKQIVVTKGIIELGKEKKSSYEKILKYANEHAIKFITTDPYFKKLDTNESVILMKGEKQLQNWFSDNMDSDTAVLLEGRFRKSFIKALGVNV